MIYGAPHAKNIAHSTDTDFSKRKLLTAPLPIPLATYHHLDLNKMAKDKEKSKDDKDEEERMKRIMMAATGYATIEEARNKRSAGVGRDGRAVTSAKEFLEDMEGDVKHDLASASLEIIAPDEKEDMKLNSV